MSLTSILLVLTVFPAEPGDTWPAFRGVGNSVAEAANLPAEWTEASTTWSVELPGYGQSSPVIWKGRVFVTSALGDTKANVSVAAIDLHSGKILWKKQFKAAAPAKINGYVSVAAPTPVVDAGGLYAFFETGNLVALDHDGKMIWQRTLTVDHGPFLGNHGLGSSLAITDKAVLVLICHDGPSYLLAVDKASGKTIWKADRPKAVSWSSPIVDVTGKEPRVFVSSSGTCEAIDASSGEQLWRVEGLDGNTVPSATVTDDLVVVGSSRIGENLAIRRGGTGDVTKSHVAWRSTEATATFSSPLVYRGLVYMVNRAGVAFCLDATSGKSLWKHRIGESCWASPLAADDRIYFFGKSGKTTVVAAGPKLNVLARNELKAEDRVYGVAAVNRRSWFAPAGD